MKVNSYLYIIIPNNHWVVRENKEMMNQLRKMNDNINENISKALKDAKGKIFFVKNHWNSCLYLESEQKLRDCRMGLGLTKIANGYCAYSLRKQKANALHWEDMFKGIFTAKIERWNMFHVELTLRNISCSIFLLLQYMALSSFLLAAILNEI